MRAVFGTYFGEDVAMLVAFAEKFCKAWCIGPYELAPTTDGKHLHYWFSFAKQMTIKKVQAKLGGWIEPAKGSER